MNQPNAGWGAQPLSNPPSGPGWATPSQPAPQPVQPVPVQPVQPSLPFEPPVSQPQPQPQIFPSLPESTPEPVTAVAESVTIMQLLRNFAAQPGCERYSADSEKVSLLTDYLWLRQLTPSLPFETFLERYAAIADFDEENKKHPADAIKFLLPRNAKLATQLGKTQWTAKEVVEYTALYVDVIREAERASTPVQFTFNAWLQMENVITAYRAGEFKEPTPPPKKRTKSEGKAKVAVSQRPTGADQRCVYTPTTGHQRRGYVRELIKVGDVYVANFQADSGELFRSLALDTLERIEDPSPNQPQTPTGDLKPELANVRLRIPVGQQTEIARALNCPGPLGTVEIGDACQSLRYKFPDGNVAVINIINGEPRPYVDASLLDPQGVVLADVQPREHIEGNYTFDTETGYYLLEVISG
jgi:hypothetical protein